VVRPPKSENFAGGQFLVAGPAPESNSVTQAFDNLTATDLESFLINMGSSGTVDGSSVLTYDLYNVDPNAPNFNPTTDTVSLGNELTAGASVTAETQSVPEPGSLLLEICGLAGCLLLKKDGVCAKRCSDAFFTGVCFFRRGQIHTMPSAITL
jgi:hypothetical protein